MVDMDIFRSVILNVIYGRSILLICNSIEVLKISGEMELWLIKFILNFTFQV